MDNDQKEFLGWWFSGFADGLEKLDDEQRTILLRACGKACAASYTANLFRETWQQNADLPQFLEQLSEKFPGGSYRLIDEHTLSVSYRECGCDLVKLGWIKTPLLCGCSANNLQQNFEAALAVPVGVEILTSILDGQDQCTFLVSLGEDHEQ
jgi:predicted ArsR family transcriptional regulator